MQLREAGEADLPVVAGMFDDFVRGHPAEHLPRSLENLRAAYLGDERVAHLLLATRGERVLGMVQWCRFFDPFWSMFGVRADWLYVCPDARGCGISAALIAEVCARGRVAGAVSLHGIVNDEAVARLYARVAIGVPALEYYVAAEAFQAFADLAGRPTREIVRGLPDPALNRTPARPRYPPAGARSTLRP